MKMTITIETNDLPGVPAEQDGLIGVVLESFSESGELVIRESDGAVNRSVEAIAEKAGCFVRAEVVKHDDGR